MNRHTTVAFTGHRHYAGEAATELALLVRSLYEEGYRTFLCGMAIGFDLAAGEAVVALREEYPEVRLVAVVPCVGQERAFSPIDRLRYAQLLEQADARIVLAQRYHKGCYHERNAYLIDHAACLVAWYDGTMGGTQQSFLLALHRGLRVENLGTIAPDPRLF